MYTIILIAMLAAPGDVIYVLEGDRVVLSQAEKLELASVVASLQFEDVKPASLDKLHCRAHVPQPVNKQAVDFQSLATQIFWTCRAADTDPDLTDERVLDMELDDSGSCRVRDRGSDTLLVCVRQRMSQDGELLLGAFTQSVFSSTLLRSYSVLCERNPEDATEITCLPHGIAIKSPTLWRNDRRTGTRIKRVIGRVAP